MSFQEKKKNAALSIVILLFSDLNIPWIGPIKWHWHTATSFVKDFCFLCHKNEKLSYKISMPTNGKYDAKLEFPEQWEGLKQKKNLLSLGYLNYYSLRTATLIASQTFKNSLSFPGQLINDWQMVLGIFMLQDSIFSILCEYVASPKKNRSLLYMRVPYRFFGIRDLGYFKAGIRDCEGKGGQDSGL